MIVVSTVIAMIIVMFNACRLLIKVLCFLVRPWFWRAVVEVHAVGFKSRFRNLSLDVV